MEDNFFVRHMKEDELHIAIDWAEKEGWNPGINDQKCFFQADPNGFFIGVLNDEPIATGAAVAYDDSFAFCGLYIVKKEYRHHGYGLKLTEERLKYAGNRITGIDGVLENVEKYKRIGYIPAHISVRYEMPSLLVNHPKEGPHIQNLQLVPKGILENYDRRYFPAQRPAFLSAWISQPESYAMGYLDAESLKGYGVIRKCRKGYKIGPLCADSPAIAQDLLESLIVQVKEGPIYMDIPEPNKTGLMLAEHYHMNPVFEVMRMYRNGNPHLDLANIYGFTTFELG